MSVSIFDAGQSPIVFNQSNLIPSANNNQYNYILPGGQTFKDAKIAIGNVNLYYSWFNITAAYGNNKFSFIWPNNNTTTTYNVTIPDGNYSVSSLNTYIQQFCLNNSLYLTDSGGNKRYYILCQTNSSYYSVEFDFSPIPNAADAATASLTAPGGWPGFNTASNKIPQLIVPASTTLNSFSTLIGYAAGTFPASNTSTVIVGVQSTFAPQVSPVKSIIVAASLVSNKLGVNNQVLGAFAYTSTTFGQLINYAPSFPFYIDIADGSYNNIMLTFYDNNFNPLPIYDSNITVQLYILQKK